MQPTPTKGARVLVTNKNMPYYFGRVGTFTGETHRSGTAQVLRYTIQFPHSRTKTRTVQLAMERSEFDVVSHGRE